jgi:hypothetical protein
MMDILRNIKDLANNPALYAEMLTDRIRNFNSGQKAVIRSGEAGMVPMTLEERTQQFTQGALDNIAPGGAGAMAVVKGAPRLAALDAISKAGKSTWGKGYTPYEAATTHDYGTIPYNEFIGKHVLDPFKDEAYNIIPTGEYDELSKYSSKEIADALRKSNTAVFLGNQMMAHGATPAGKYVSPDDVVHGRFKSPVNLAGFTDYTPDPNASAHMFSVEPPKGSLEDAIAEYLRSMK